MERNPMDWIVKRASRPPFAPNDSIDFPAWFPKGLRSAGPFGEDGSIANAVISTGGGLAMLILGLTTAPEFLFFVPVWVILSATFIRIAIKVRKKP